MIFGEHQRLAEILEKQESIPAVQTFEFLDAIEAPPGMRQLPTVASSLLEILPVLSQIYPYDIVTIASLLRVAKTIVNKAQILEEKVPSLGISASGKNPLHNIISQNPLYCALWTYPHTEKGSVFFRHLQAHFLGAVNRFRLFEHQAKAEGFISTRQTISLLLRVHLKKDFLLDELCNWLPSPPQLPYPFYMEVSQTLAQEKLQGNVRKALRKLRLLLGRALQLDGEGSRNRSHSLRELEDSIFIKHERDEDAEVVPGNYEIVKTRSLSRNLIKEGRAEGDSLYEHFKRHEVLYDKEPLRSRQGESPQMRALKAKTSCRYIASGNQLLAGRWELLNFYDVVLLIRYCGRLSAKQIIFPEEEKISGLYVSAFIALMFFFSKPQEQVQNSTLRVARTPPETLEPKDGLVLHSDGGKLTCYFATPKLDYSRKSKASEEPFLRPTTATIALPLSTMASNLIRPWVEERSRGRGRKRSLPLFPKSITALDEVLKAKLKFLNSEVNGRLTKHRISSYFKQYLADHLGDYCEASLCLGELPPTGQKTALYYSATGRELLQRKYLQACEKLEQRLRQQIGLPQQIQLIHGWSVKKYLGSETCPFDQTVSLLVEDLVNRVEFYRRNKHEAASLINFHNAFTAYCVVLLSYSTGYRAVSDPLFQISEYDEDGKFIVISDKDDLKNYNSRLVCVPKQGMDQIVAYKTHRFHLANHLLLVTPGLAEALKRAENKEPYFNGHTIETDEAAIPFFFFLDQHDFSLQRVKPATLKEYIRWSYHLPLNANRHYLRTKLREKKVPGELVDAYMGHWEYGQEPFGKFSTLSPIDFSSQLIPKLENILDEAGWYILKGLDG